MIELKNLTKSFGSRIVTNGLFLTVQPKEFLVIIGRSGEGKSVLLKQIIGLLSPDSGSVMIDGEDITKFKKHQKEDVFKKCGYVFQFAALLDSLTVFENVGITLLEQGKKVSEVHPLVAERLNAVGLEEDVLHKFPSELSGGMKKRVGLARTLMAQPKILIYDEPTTGLDPITARLIRDLMKRTHDKYETTTVVISHDVEIFKYASHVAMLHEGKIVCKCEAQSVWDNDNPYLYQFIRGLPEGPIKQPSVISK
jgi:phospholipid/cholesterol/gamma-HCH transport system ATP-binding protein